MKEGDYNYDLKLSTKNSYTFENIETNFKEKTLEDIISDHLLIFKLEPEMLLKFMQKLSKTSAMARRKDFYFYLSVCSR